MPLNDRDYDLLSLYIDDALTPPERRAVESRLASDTEMRAELDALRQTIALLKAMPEMVAPRDLRLSSHQVAETLAEFKTPRPVKRPPVTLFRIASNIAAAAASLVLVLAGTFTLLRPLAPAMPPSIAMSSDTAQEEPAAVGRLAGTPETPMFDMAAPDGTAMGYEVPGQGGMGGAIIDPEGQFDATTMQLVVPTEAALFESMPVMATDSGAGSADADFFDATDDPEGSAPQSMPAPFVAAPTATPADSSVERAMSVQPAATQAAFSTATLNEESSNAAEDVSPDDELEQMSPDETAIADLSLETGLTAQESEGTLDLSAESDVLPDDRGADSTLTDARVDSDTGLPASSPLLGLGLIVAGLVLGVSTLIARSRR